MDHEYAHKHTLCTQNMCTYMHVHTHTHARTHACTHTHTQAHAHTHTHTISLANSKQTSQLSTDCFQRQNFLDFTMKSGTKLGEKHVKNAQKLMKVPVHSVGFLRGGEARIARCLNVVDMENQISNHLFLPQTGPPQVWGDWSVVSGQSGNATEDGAHATSCADPQASGQGQSRWMGQGQQFDVIWCCPYDSGQNHSVLKGHYSSVSHLAYICVVSGSMRFLLTALERSFKGDMF